MSARWKREFTKQFTCKQQLKIELELTDPTLLKTISSVTFYNKNNYCDVGTLFYEKGVKFQDLPLLDRNSYVLDGTKSFYKNETIKGFLGNEFSQDDLRFTNGTPKIEVALTQSTTYSIPSITLIWSEINQDFAKDFKIEFKKGAAVVLSKHIVDNQTPTTTIDEDIPPFDSFDISIYKWNLPGRVAKLQHISFGKVLTFTNEEIINFKFDHSCSVLSEHLCDYNVSFAIDNSKREYDILSETNRLIRFLKQRQKLTVYHGLELNPTEWVKFGTYYLSEWANSRNSLQVEFKANDILYHMTANYHKGLYKPQGATYHQLAVDVLEDSKIRDVFGSSEWVLSNKLKQIKTKQAMPITTHANCLQMIAQATGMVLSIDVDGKVVIKEADLDGISNNSYTPFTSLTKVEVLNTIPIKALEYVIHHTASSDKQESDELHKGNVYLDSSNHVLIQHDPSGNIHHEITNGSIVRSEHYTRSSVFQINPNGSNIPYLKLSGRKLVESSSTYIQELSEYGTIAKIDNELVDDLGVIKQNIELHKQYLLVLYDFEVDVRLDSTTKVNDNILLYYDELISNAKVLSISGSFNGMMKATLKGKLRPIAISMHANDDVYAGEVEY